jgi:ABC-2 type transport system permease protein
MKALDIALKDLARSFRSATALVFMLGIPLLVTGGFYLMLGNAAQDEGFDLPRVRVVVANLDQDAPRLQAGSGGLPDGIRADTMSELVVAVLSSEDLADLLEVSELPDAAAARQAVDSRQAQVAVIIPPDFSRQFSEVDGQSVVELYQDPTLTIGPAIVRSILSSFMDSLSAVKIAVDQALENGGERDYALVGRVLEAYMSSSRTQTSDLAAEFLESSLPAGKTETTNPVLAIVTPIMVGMMIFYAFYTGVSTAQSILIEDEQHTLRRLFTTPTPRSVILSGKFLSVFLTVLVQAITLMIAAHWIFGIEWGEPASVGPAAAGVVVSAAAFGIFINSLLKSTRHGGMVFGGVLTVSGILGMISIFGMGSPTAVRMGETVSLLVPQGWAVRGMLAALDGQTPVQILPNLLVLLAWSAVFIAIGVWRFRRRYA